MRRVRNDGRESGSFLQGTFVRQDKLKPDGSESVCEAPTPKEKSRSLGCARDDTRRRWWLEQCQPSFQDLRAFFPWFPRTSSWAKFGDVPFGTLRARRCSPAARFAGAF